MIEEFNAKYNDVYHVALVGHAPYLSGLVSMVLAGDPNLSLELKKGGIRCFTTEDLAYARCANLNWMLSPVQLIEVGRSFL